MSALNKIIKDRLIKGIVSMDLPASNPPLEVTGLELQAAIKKALGHSLHIREVDTGSCGACEAEIIAATNPLYDLQRFGVNFVASPKHADALLVTGPVSKNMLLALQKTYANVPEPKFVITLGDCANGGGPFKNSYYVENGVKDILPVTLHIPGCPPTPLEIINHLLAFMKQLNKKDKS